MSIPVTVTLLDRSCVVEVSEHTTGRQMKEMVEKELDVEADYFDLCQEGTAVGDGDSVMGFCFGSGDEFEATPNKKIQAMRELKLSAPPTLCQLRKYIHRSDGENTHLYIDAGIMINSCDNEGQTPLFYAVASGNVTAARQLLANPDCALYARDIFGRGAVDLALSFNRSAILKLFLLDSRVSINKGCKDTPCLLYHAVSCDANTTCLRMLLECPDIDVNNNTSGETPLQLACRRAHRGAVVELLNHPNIDTKIGDREHRPLTITRKSGFHSLAKLIKEHDNGYRVR